MYFVNEVIVCNSKENFIFFFHKKQTSGCVLKAHKIVNQTENLKEKNFNENKKKERNK